MGRATGEGAFDFLEDDFEAFESGDSGDRPSFVALERLKGNGRLSLRDLGSSVTSTGSEARELRPL